MSSYGKNNFIKTLATSVKYDEVQEDELMKCADPVDGPVFFMRNFVYIQHPVKGSIIFEPFHYQLDLVHNYHNYRFSINMLGRQMGKTTCAAAYILWYSMFIPDSTILIAAHKYTGAQEIMQRVRYAYEHCPDHIRDAVVDYNKGSMTFANGSRIVSATTTETTGRGLSISLLYCDEFSYVRPTIAREFWTSISPTLSTGGKAIITSTPNSDEDTFAHIWRESNKTLDEYGNDRELGTNGFKAYKADWTKHPERDQKWSAEEKSRLGDEKFRREHCLEFIRDDEL
jgi:hypothetical protein